MSFSVFTLEERPDLKEAVGALDLDLPEFMHHSDVDDRLWHRLFRDLPSFQLAVREGNVIVAAGYTIPLSASLEDLPERGWDAAFEGGFEDFDAGRPPNLLCALLAVVDSEKRGRGTSREVLRAMRNLASEKELSALIAPVRPTMKSAYPLTPMERYVGWRREDGLLFDPWMRVHERLGAKVVRVAPESMKITGSIAEWEEWTKMRFPESGEYVVEGALAPVSMDVEKDTGTYVEPNVWMVHEVASLPVIGFTNNR